MKKLIYGTVFLAIVGIGLVACKKDTVSAENERQTKTKELLTEAKSFSKEHNENVMKVLDGYEISMFNVNSMNETQAFCDIVNNELGTKAYISTEVNNTYSIINFEDETLKLADYFTDKQAKLYLSKIDELLFITEEDNLDKLISGINKVENEMVSDESVSIESLESALNAIETLKGSLVLWSKYFNNQMITKGICDWKRWQKILFVAAADAVGAITGSFGVSITINGIPIVVPPGFVGAAVSAALVSLFATIFVAC